MLKVGDFVFDNTSGNDVQILEIIDMWGYITYRVFNPVSNTVYKINEDQISRNSKEHVYDENYIRYVVLNSKIKNELSEGILTSLPNTVIPLPHQIYTLNRALKTNQVRYILADEVGLGKTIEAGLIIKELKTRGLIKRILVVCPTGLVTQWSQEMKEKFNEKFNVILPADYDTIRRISDNDDIYGQFDQVISPMDSIKPIEKHAGWDEERIEKYNQERIYSIINSGWDLIIIDEAHRVAGSSSEVARYKLGHMLSEASPYLLLLSATPHNGKTEPFLRLIRLLDEDAFPNAKSIVKEQVAPYLIRTEKRQAIDNEGNLLFKNRYTHLEELHWEARHSLQQEMYEKVTEYVGKTYNKAIRNQKKNMYLIFLLIIFQRMTTSSTAAIKESLERRLEFLEAQNFLYHALKQEDIYDIDIESGSEEALEAEPISLKDEIQKVKELLELANRAEIQHLDVKVEKLVEILDRLFAANRNQKVIIFTEFVGTQKFLQRSLDHQGFDVTILNGSMSIEERNLALEEFRDKNNIFISTDAGGEGLNLQFANVIINYDLPWNPMKIEQRCGRVDRIGQKEDVHIYNLIVADTVENRVREVLEEKLAVILDEMGVDKYSDVLDSQASDQNFTDAYMRTISRPNNLSINTNGIEMDLKEAVANAQKYKEILTDEKDLSSLIGSESSFDIHQSLSRMLQYYHGWKREEIKLEMAELEDPEVVECLNTPIIQDASSDIMSVSIKDFPNEEGYFMLWKLSISNDEDNCRRIPVFINKDFIIRPLSGQRIMDMFLNEYSQFKIDNYNTISKDIFDRLKQISMNIIHDQFINLRADYLQKSEDQYRKYSYAWKLRKESVDHIGIENIRQTRIKRLDEEKDRIEKEYQRGKQIYPEVTLILLLKLEA